MYKYFKNYPKEGRNLGTFYNLILKNRINPSHDFNSLICLRKKKKKKEIEIKELFKYFCIDRTSYIQNINRFELKL